MSEEAGKTRTKLSEEAFLEQFDRLYTSFANDVIRVSYFYLGDRGKAEDVCHDVFVSLFVNRPELEEGSEKKWLLKVALNRCRDIWRSAWVRRVVMGSPAFEMIPAPDVLGQQTEKQEILKAVYSLPAEFREIIILFYYQGYGVNEISQMLGVPEGTVSSRLARARKKLMPLLSEGGGKA